MRFKIALTTLLLSAAAQSTQAGGFTLVPSGALRAVAPLEVKGRNGILIRQHLQFGPYQTAFVKRGAINQWGSAVSWTNDIWVQSTSGKQSIRFALTNGTDTAEAIGTTRIHRNELVIGNPNSVASILTDVLSVGSDLQENNLSVGLRMPGEKTPWELYVDNEAAQLRRSDAAGYLRQGAVVYTLHPVWRIRTRKGKEMDMLFGAVGLEFRNAAGDAVAAVNLMDNGTVHVNEQLPAPEKLLLSTACTALLLQSVI